MKLTFGELSVITETLQQSLGFADWQGFTKEARESILHKLYNDQSLVFDISVGEEKDK